MKRLVSVYVDYSSVDGASNGISLNFWTVRRLSLNGFFSIYRQFTFEYGMER